MLHVILTRYKYDHFKIQLYDRTEQYLLTLT